MTGLEVTIYTVDVQGTAEVRAKGRMDVESVATRADAVAVLSGFLDEMHGAHLPGDDRRFLVVSADFPGMGEVAVTGLGVEVEQQVPELTPDDLPALREKLTDAQQRAEDDTLSETTRRKYRKQCEALRETIARLT